MYNLKLCSKKKKKIFYDSFIFSSKYVYFYRFKIHEKGNYVNRKN